MNALAPWQLIIVLIGSGTLLLIAEIFAPGIILGTIGGLCLLASIILTYARHGATAGSVVLFIELFGLALGLGLWMKYFSKTALGRRMVLTESNPDQTRHKFQSLLNCEGSTVTDCRPAGVAEFQGRRYDVIAESAFLSSGQPVKVVQVEGPKITVRLT